MPTTPPAIGTLPPPPDPNNRATFNALAYPWSVALNPWATQLAAVAANVKANADEAEADAIAANASRVAAANSQTAAAASAASALGAPGTNATSVTSLTISLGSKSLTIQTDKAYTIGQAMLIADTSNPAINWMWGQVSSYNSGTGALVVSVSMILGSGTLSNWTLSLSPNPLVYEAPTAYGSKLVSTELAIIDAPIATVQPRTTLRITGTGQLYRLPDARTLPIGRFCEIFNTGGTANTIIKSDGTLAWALPTGAGLFDLWLTDNTTEGGVWAIQSTATAYSGRSASAGSVSLQVETGSALAGLLANVAFTDSIPLDSTRTLYLLGGDDGTNNNAAVYGRVVTVSRTGLARPTVSMGATTHLYSTTRWMAQEQGVLAQICVAQLSAGSFVATATTRNSASTSKVSEVFAFTVSGSTITVGTPTTLCTNTAMNSPTAQIAATSATGFALVHGTSTANVTDFVCRAGTVSGTTVTLGTASAVQSKITANSVVTLASNMDGTALAVCFHVQPNLWPMTISGTTLTMTPFGAASGGGWSGGPSTAGPVWTANVCGIGSGKFLIWHHDNSNLMICGCATVSAGVLTLATATSTTGGPGQQMGNSRRTAFGAYIGGGSGYFPAVVTGTTVALGGSVGTVTLQQGIGRISGYTELAGGGWFVKGDNSILRHSLVNGVQQITYGYTGVGGSIMFSQNPSTAQIVDGGKCVLSFSGTGNYALTMLDFTIA